MKLLKAEIDGFGQLYGQRVPMDAPVIIVYGPNEAGKSTMFSFIRSMLYGFAKRGQAALRQEPVNGGKHGGRLFFTDQSGKRYVLERYSADGSSKLKLRGLDYAGVVEQASSDTDGYLEFGQTFADEVVLTQADWERRFLGNVTERLYRQLFAITLTELQEVGALSGEELGRYLYQAGWDSGRQIAAAEKRLVQEMEQLFKPRGTNQQINQQLKSLEQLEAALRKRADAIAAYNELTQQAEKLDLSLIRLERELPLCAARQQLLNKACSVRPLWMRKQKLILERSTVAYASSLSAQAEKSWEELIRQRTERRAAAEQIRHKEQLLALQLQSITFDERFIQMADETDALLQAAESMRKLRSDSSEMEVELREHDEAIARLVSSIAPEWTERQLREFHVTVADRDFVRQARQQQFDEARQEERLAAELEALAQQEREAAYAWDEAEAAVGREAERREREDGAGLMFLPRTRDALKEAWNAVDSALREWELERVRAAGAAAAASGSGAAGRGAAAAGRGGAGPLWAAAAGAGGAALALGVAALSGAAAGEAAGGAGIVVLALAGAALALVVAALARSRSGGSAARMARIASLAGDRSARLAKGENGRAWTSAAGRRMRGPGGTAIESSKENTALGEVEQRLRHALAALIREPEAAASAIIAALQTAHQHYAPDHAQAAEQARTQLRAAVEARLEALQNSERLIDNRSELARRLDRLRALARERSEATAAAAQTKQAAARQWAGWLAARSLPASMSPSAALEAFELAEQAVQRLHQYDRLAAKKAAAAKQLAAFALQAAALCEGFDEASRQLTADPALALRLLHAEIRRHAAAKQEARGMEARRDELRLSLKTVEAQLEELEAAVAAQMESADVQNEAQYETALEHRRIAAELDLELSKLELEITAGMSEDRIAELEELYVSNDDEQLQTLQAASQAELAQLEKQKHEQLEQRGRLLQSIDHLLKEEERQKLLAQKEMTVAQLEADAERYAVLSISAALIRRTKRIYEEERQPVVLRNASGYIADLTDGKYIRILTTPGEAGIRLESSDQRLIDSTMLSRGTAEQVYLAMRLALAEEASQSIKLPLMLDDVFVNFDRVRLQAAAKLVAELSGSRQMIVMTCHEHVRDALLEHCHGATLVLI
ncbi:MAG: AAA family ATPase [Bacillota bacterium]